MELPCLAFHSCGRSTQLFSGSEHKRIVDAGGDIVDMDEVLTGKVVCPTAQGHLLVRDPATLSAFLWNPRDGQHKIHLPALRGMDDDVLMYSHCLLSDEPTAPGCVVLLVEPGDTCIWYVHLGDKDGSWVKHDYEIGEPLFLEYDDDGEPVYDKNLICWIAACRGKFYFNSFATELGVLEFCPGPVFSSIEIDNTIAADGNYGYGGEDDRPGFIHLVESDGELYMVTLQRRGTGTGRTQIRRASVHRMDFAERRWRKVDGLGGRVFLLSPFYFGASCLVGGGDDDHGSLRKDCVYLVCAREKALVVFDVKEGTIERQKLDEVSTEDKELWLLPTNSSSIFRKA